jgi:bacterioferritin-associated ferredoxin
VYLCVCKAVTDGQVREAVASGCSSAAAVAAETGASTDCGSCRPALCAEIRRARDARGTTAGVGLPLGWAWGTAVAKR